MAVRRRQALGLVVALLALAEIGAPAAACQRADFERVVEEAALGLRDLNLANKPVFQAKLGELRTKRGWSHDQFIEKAAPLVQDQTIFEFDARSAALLEKLQAGGDAGAAARAPDCKLLAELKGTMKSLIDVQTAKWSYMLTRIEAELQK